MAKGSVRILATSSVLAAALAASGMFSACMPDTLGNCVDACEGNARRVCDDFSDSRGQLEECGPARRCVDTVRSYGYYAVCALRGPDRRCNPETNVELCDGRRVVVCRGAYPTEEIDCASTGRFCGAAAKSSPRAACVESEAPDPRCDDGTTTRHSFCDGDRPALCYGRFVSARAPACAEQLGRQCVEIPASPDHPARASCQLTM